MKLELGICLIRDMRFADTTRISDHVLCVNKKELAALLLADRRLGSLELEIVRPNERERVIHVLDVIEPRIKVEGPGAIFPGMIGKLERVGEGRSHVLKVVAVV